MLINKLFINQIRTGSNYLGKGLEDLFYKGGVDLVFGGHNHQYERMYPVYDLQVSIIHSTNHLISQITYSNH